MAEAAGKQARVASPVLLVAGAPISCDGTIRPCTESGIRGAIAEGGGPFTFDCDGPTTVVTEAEIVVDNDVILDGCGELTVDGNDDHGVFSVSGVTAELRNFALAGGNNARGAISQLRNVEVLTNSTVSGNPPDAREVVASSLPGR